MTMSDHIGAVHDYLRRESVATLAWPVGSSDVNPIEYIWDIISRQVRKRTPPIQTFDELTQALHQEWQALLQHQIQHLIIDFKKTPRARHVHGSYTRY